LSISFGVQVFLQNSDFTSLGHVPRRKTAELYGGLILKFWRNPYTVFHNVCTSVVFSPAVWGVGSLLSPGCQHWLSVTP
jgi:hypothetical protein